jgi:hypothetical protein
MDDLTTLKGIGKATAKRLIDAGISSFAALAAASPDQFQAIDKLGSSPAEWAEWVAAAKTRLPAAAAAPVDLQTATPDQVNAQAALIDAARAKLTEAGTAAADAQASGDAVAVEAARLAVAAAQAELDGLIGPGATSPNSSHNPASEAEDGEAGETAAGLPGTEVAAGQDDDNAAGTERDEYLAFVLDDEVAEKAIAALRGRVQRLIQEEGPGGAREFITSERTLISATVSRLQRFDSELLRLGVECERTESVWPVETIRYDGAEQPIGLELKVDPKTAAALLASGAASDHAPASESEGV